MNKNLETAAIALGIGIILFVGYRSIKGSSPTATSAIPRPQNNYGYMPDYTPSTYSPADPNLSYDNARDQRLYATAASARAMGGVQ